MRIVVALGGNALGGGEVPAAVRVERYERTARQLVDLIEAGHQLVVTHGNGPQVGELMLDQDLRARDGRGQPVPIDVLVAMTQAELGYRLQRALGRELDGRGLDIPVVSLITQVVVAAADEAFATPTKPVGPGYHQRPRDGLPYVLTRGDRWRRVVASPLPQRVVEIEALRAVLASGIVPICGGGGGIPVAERGGRLVGVEAVIDKDLTSALVAHDVDADALLILTDVEHVMRHHGTPAATAVRELPLDEARAMVADGDAATGSMGPKLLAVARAAEEGRLAVIARLGSAVAALAGEVGTRIVAPTSEAD